MQPGERGQGPYNTLHGHTAYYLLRERSSTHSWHKTPTQAILQTRVGSRPRFVGPGQRLLTLCTLSLCVMHWYACGMWLIGERQAAAGQGTWVAQAMDG